MNARVLGVSRRVTQFLRWWATELAACAAELMGLIAPRWRAPVVVYIDSGRLLIRTEGAANTLAEVEVERDHFRSALPERLPDPLPSLLERGRRARLVIATGNAFVRQWRLPLAAVPHLKSAISLHLSKLLPMQRAQLLTDFEIAAADPAKGVVDIEVAALKRLDVEPMLKSMQAWGLRVTSIRLADTPDSRERFRIASADLSGREWRVRRADRVLIGTAAALSLACAAVAATQSYRSQRTFEQAKGQTSILAASALSQRQSLLARLDPLIALSRVQSAPGAPELLADVTKLVPHDTWLTTFELKERRLRLVGLSPDPAAVVKLLASSALLNDVELRSTMSAGIGTGKDRFELTAETKESAP